MSYTLDLDESLDEESKAPRLIQGLPEPGEAPKDVSQNSQNEARSMAIPCYFLLYFLM